MKRAGLPRYASNERGVPYIILNGGRADGRGEADREGSRQ